MTDWLLALVPQYGLWLLAATTFFSCLALPFPASIMMLTAGGFVAAGDLALLPTFAAAAGGASPVISLVFGRAARSARRCWTASAATRHATSCCKNPWRCSRRRASSRCF